MPPSSEANRFVVAIDFGTTFSQVAYIYGGDCKNVEVIRNWPSNGNRSIDRVPTELLYFHRESSTVQRDPSGRRQYFWGYGVEFRKEKKMVPLKWFKLLLEDRNPFIGGKTYGTDFKRNVFQNEPEPTSSIMETSSLATLFTVMSPPSEQSRSSASSEGRVTKTTPAAETTMQMFQLWIPPIEVVTDYLRSLREYTISVLEIRFPAAFIRQTKIEYVLTVPAVWSDSAKTFTSRAAKNAGFGEYETDFKLIGEPEAAATYSLPAMGLGNLDIGDTFVVCDAGGGTVDLVSYKIDKLDPLVFHEVVGGSGSLCGSVFIDELFEEHVRQLLGNAVIDEMKPAHKKAMMMNWEYKVKFQFSGAEEIKHYKLCIPGVRNNKAKGLEGGILTLSQETVKQIFDPVIDAIVELVEDQIRNVKEKEERVAAILLVGGLGSSHYLKKRLREHNFFGFKVDVMQPQNASTAIVRGALIQSVSIDGSFVNNQIKRSHCEVNYLKDDSVKPIDDAAVTQRFAELNDNLGDWARISFKKLTKLDDLDFINVLTPICIPEDAIGGRLSYIEIVQAIAWRSIEETVFGAWLFGLEIEEQIKNLEHLLANSIAGLSKLQEWRAYTRACIHNSQQVVENRESAIDELTRAIDSYLLGIAEPRVTKMSHDARLEKLRSIISSAAKLATELNTQKAVFTIDHHVLPHTAYNPDTMMEAFCLETPAELVAREAKVSCVLSRGWVKRVVGAEGGDALRICQAMVKFSSA